MLEALYTVEFGDVAGQGFQNGGVVVLETGRLYGGDSGYYYLGTYSVENGQLLASATVVKHDATWRNAFGSADKKFEIKIEGLKVGDVMTGTMHRLDNPKAKLPIRLTKQQQLP